MFVSFRVFFSFRTSTSNTPRPSAHHSFRPRPQRGEYKIMGSKLSNVSLGTTSRVLSLQVKNRLMQIVVSESRSETKSRIFFVLISLQTLSNAEQRCGQKPYRFGNIKRGKECIIRNSRHFNLYHFFFSL